VARSPLWRRGDFLRFWAAASVSLTGDAVTLLALPLIAIGSLEASPFQVGRDRRSGRSRARSSRGRATSSVSRICARSR